MLDEVGVMHLQARWQNGDSIPDLVTDCLTLLSSDTASVRETISAAGWLLTAADNMCDKLLGQRVYDRVADQLTSPEIATDMRLSFEMIYNCSFGDASLSRDLADELATYARRSCPPMLILRYLRLASQVHRCHSTAERALCLGIESFEMAERLNASIAMASCSNSIASIFLHIGDNELAEQWSSRAMNAHSAGRHSVLNSNLWSYQTELAIRRGDSRRAAEFYSRCVSAAERAKSPRSLARILALGVQITVLDREPIDAETLKSFLKIFELTKTATLQDFNAESLILALESVNRLTEAQGLARNFLQTDRRDLCTLPAKLVAVTTRLLDTRQQAS
jgi:hypothetical protein